MKRIAFISLPALYIFALFLIYKPASGGLYADPQPLPEFTGNHADWINSEPLSKQEIKGKVILLDFWTFDCWNCYRSFPWLNELEKKLSEEDFLVIGIHTPEFEHEKNRDNVVAKTEAFKLHHPVMMDNNFTYWKAFKNRYWPSFYLVDKQGNVRANFIGETHVGDANARQIENVIRALLAE